MAQSFDDEQICERFLSNINWWKKFNARNFQPPKKNKLKYLTEKLTELEMRSPEEQTCLDIMEKYKLYREIIMKNL